MKKLLIAVVALIVIGGGVGYLLLSQEELSFPTLPFQKSSAEDLQGIWKIKQALVLDPETKEFKEIPQQQNQPTMYAEFKGDQFCSSGYLNDQGQPKPCEQYNQTAVKGDTFTVSGSANFSQTLFKWKIKGNELEIVMEAVDPASVPADQPSKIKFIFSRIK